VGVLIAGVLSGELLLFVTREVLAVPAAIVVAVALDLWLRWRAGAPLLD
jgi:hypothetical protein